jgi:hypothetical protein
MFFSWLAEHAGEIITFVSLLLNGLHGTGVVRPMVDLRKPRSAKPPKA